MHDEGQHVLLMLCWPHHLQQASTCHKKDYFLLRTVHAAGAYILAPKITCPQSCKALHATALSLVLLYLT